MIHAKISRDGHHGIKDLKCTLDKLTPLPEDDGWLRQSAAYHRIFEESEQEQRAYYRMIMGLLSEQEGITISVETWKRCLPSIYQPQDYAEPNGSGSSRTGISHPGYNHQRSPSNGTNGPRIHVLWSDLPIKRKTVQESAKFKPMARFELATSSLPRRHTAGLCHIGILCCSCACGLTRSDAVQITIDRLLNNVVSNPYKTLRKDCRKHKRSPASRQGPYSLTRKFS